MTTSERLMLLTVVFLAITVSDLTAADRIPGDIDGDGEVAFSDFLILAANFGQSGPPPTTDTIRDMNHTGLAGDSIS